jgi:hypothetical protein
MHHIRDGLARPCSAWDLILITGGVQCGNCLATEVRPTHSSCSDHASDGPCPLPSDGPDGVCWIHRIQRMENPNP